MSNLEVNMVSVRLKPVIPSVTIGHIVLSGGHGERRLQQLIVTTWRCVSESKSNRSQVLTLPASQVGMCNRFPETGWNRFKLARMAKPDQTSFGDDKPAQPVFCISYFKWWPDLGFLDLLGGGGMTLGNHDHDHVWSCHSSPLLSAAGCRASEFCAARVNGLSIVQNLVSTLGSVQELYYHSDVNANWLQTAIKPITGWTTNRINRFSKTIRLPIPNPRFPGIRRPRDAPESLESWDFWDSEPRSVSDLGDFNLGFWWKQPGILVSKNLG